MSEEIKKYMKEIGRKGGQKSKRTINPEQQKKMQEARKAKKADIEQKEG